MSAKQRRDANTLERRYANHFRVALADIRTVLREDEEVEVWAPGVGIVWTTGGAPYATTVAEALLHKGDTED